jgi:hypothetical protein
MRTQIISLCSYTLPHGAGKYLQGDFPAQVNRLILFQLGLDEVAEERGLEHCARHRQQQLVALELLIKAMLV